MNINFLQNELKSLKEKDNFRKLRECNSALVDFSSNDYLGIGKDKKLLEEFYTLYKPRLSSSSSRLIDGSYSEVMELERELEKIYSKKALVFNSGFDANSSVIETFYGKSDLIISDRLNHASIYAGIINSGAKLLRYSHLDMDNLEKLLIKYRKNYENVLVVSETIYSMDGDTADIKKLVELKKRYGFDLMIDEAHSYGVYGYGMAYEMGIVEDIDFLIIPLGKGGGSVGAYVLCSELCKDYLINKSRKFIYSTALPPVNNCWNLFILKKIPEFQEKRKRLKENIEYIQTLMRENEIQSISTTHIVSIIIGDNKKISVIAENLRKKGFLVYGVKEPTVPRGTARFRIGLNPDISKTDIERFIKELRYEINSVF